MNFLVSHLCVCVKKKKSTEVQKTVVNVLSDKIKIFVRIFLLSKTQTEIILSLRFKTYQKTED